MEGLRNLPAPILQVTVPQMFSVSAVAYSDACLLKAIFQSSSHKVGLLRGPRAWIGIIAHTLVERAVRSTKRTGNITFDELARDLDFLLDDARARLSGNRATAHYSDLPRTMSPLAWYRKRRAILDIAYETAGRARLHGGSPESRGHGNFRFENLIGDGHWVEVPIEVSELRLKGRMDMFDRRGTEAGITDIKSGHLEDEYGEIIERAIRQIRLYGLMVNWQDTKMNVTLTIHTGVERPVTFDSDIRDETLDWLRSITDQLLPGSSVFCDSLAHVGPDCKWCDMRVRCIRYLREAPSLWASNLDWPLPLDIWGTIERIDSNSDDDDFVDLTLWDSGGRQIKIFHLRYFHVAGMSPGDRIWLFNLLASNSELRGRPWRHPLNFYEIGDSAGNRGWSLHVFSDSSGA